MSAGHVHTRASLLLSAGFLLGGIFFHTSATQYVIGSLIGVMVTPDCDVDAGTIHGRYLRQRVGRVAEIFWDGLWFFYRRSLRHGCELSHFPIVSTLGRIVYLYFFLIVLPTLGLAPLFHWSVRSELAWWSDWITRHWQIVIGLMGSDLIHWVLDIATSDGKFNINSLIRGKTNGTRRTTKRKILAKGRHKGKGRVLGMARGSH